MLEQNGLRFPPTGRALVVDPADLSRTVIGHALASIDIEAASFSSLAPALSWLEANPLPDLVVVADEMHDAVVAALRVVPLFAHLPIVTVAQPMRRAALLHSVEECLAADAARTPEPMAPVTTGGADPMKTTTPGRRVPSMRWRTSFVEHSGSGS